MDPTLLSRSEIPPCLDAEDPLVQEFWRFHLKNQEVFTRLRVMALRLKADGHSRYSIAGLYEVLRYESLKTSGQPWKLSNSYRALYARLLAFSSPQLAKFFEMRTRQVNRRLRGGRYFSRPPVPPEPVEEPINDASPCSIEG